MIDIENFIKESISDTYNKKYKDTINGRYVSSISDSTWKAYQYIIGHNVNLPTYVIDFMSKDDQSDSDFLKVYSAAWYDNESGHPENRDISSIIVADYCYKKYDVKIMDCRAIGDNNERHFFLSYIPVDSNKKKGIICRPCEVQCQFTTTEGGWNGKNSEIHWGGDIQNVDEYAKMVLDYIKECFDK